MDTHSWVEEFGAAVTVCDAEGIILEMNERSARMFKEQGGRALLGSNVLDCHPEPSRTKLVRLMEQRQASTYTTEKNGRRKLIHQAPWYRGGQYAGFVEMVLPLPDAMPHFIRDGSTGAAVPRAGGADQPCPDLSDDDISAAMKEISGYLDVTPADLKEIYRRAFRHAHERIVRAARDHEEPRRDEKQPAPGD